MAALARSSWTVTRDVQGDQLGTTSPPFKERKCDTQNVARASGLLEPLVRTKMPSLPTGTVTFLFTDIKESTHLLALLGDQYADLLAWYRSMLREVVQEHGGQEVDAQGDGLFVVFPSAGDAVKAAVAAQRAMSTHQWPGGTMVRVRMGLHTGEARVAGTGYVSMNVHRAARICAAAHGGQILLSDATHALVARDLPEGISLRDLGEHRLKDLAHPHRLFQVVVPDLSTEFPPLRSLDPHRHNLPIQLTSFIGRGREITELKRLLGAVRLVTLTGSGGAGKTRLALQMAADVVERYPDGVWLAELAPIADPALVPKTVASALHVREQPGREMIETLVDALRPKSLLLVLDNCEHLLCYSWPTYQTIMRVATPGEKIVDTLRLDRPDKTIPPRGWRGRRPPIGRRVSNAGPIEGCW